MLVFVNLTYTPTRSVRVQNSNILNSNITYWAVMIHVHYEAFRYVIIMASWRFGQIRPFAIGPFVRTEPHPRPTHGLRMHTRLRCFLSLSICQGIALFGCDCVCACVCVCVCTGISILARIISIQSGARARTRARINNTRICSERRMFFI